MWPKKMQTDLLLTAQGLKKGWIYKYPEGGALTSFPGIKQERGNATQFPSSNFQKIIVSGLRGSVKARL